MRKILCLERLQCLGIVGCMQRLDYSECWKVEKSLGANVAGGNALGVGFFPEAQIDYARFSSDERPSEIPRLGTSRTGLRPVASFWVSGLLQVRG